MAKVSSRPDNGKARAQSAVSSLHPDFLPGEETRRETKEEQGLLKFCLTFPSPTFGCPCLADSIPGARIFSVTEKPENFLVDTPSGATSRIFGFTNDSRLLVLPSRSFPFHSFTACRYGWRASDLGCLSIEQSSIEVTEEYSKHLFLGSRPPNFPWRSLVAVEGPTLPPLSFVLEQENGTALIEIHVSEISSPCCHSESITKRSSSCHPPASGHPCGRRCDRNGQMQGRRYNGFASAPSTSPTPDSFGSVAIKRLGGFPLAAGAAI
ncbi:hypothetical protein C8J56DRAFT_1026739 [Mycena floridula]|nr:hypothetical protein C8J56DRAFT_1026739 [Mycena floridula]